MMPLCRAEGIGLLPWSPLARGFLAGNRQRGSKDATLRETHDHYGHTLYYAPEDYDIADRLVELARRKGVLPIQIALAWVLSQPGVTAPIVGVTKMEQFDQLIDALSLRLDAEDRKFVEERYVPHQVIGHS
jgi:aryl-alcohol dehydrogenase (NADP+)